MTSTTRSTAAADRETGSATDGDSGVENGTLNRDVVLDILSNERRRYVVHVLKRRDGDRVSDGALAERVASWELDKPTEELSYKDRKRVRNALRQFHLPKMDETGFVEYDAPDGTVALSDAAAEQDFYVDVLPKRGIPWGLYYIGLSVVATVALAGSALSLPPFAVLPPLAWSAFVSTTLLVSSVGHFYDNYYRMRLGAGETPPEVEQS